MLKFIVEATLLFDSSGVWSSKGETESRILHKQWAEFCRTDRVAGVGGEPHEGDAFHKFKEVGEMIHHFKPSVTPIVKTPAVRQFVDTI